MNPRAVVALALACSLLSCTRTRTVQAPAGSYGGFPDTGGTGGMDVDCDRDGDGARAAACGGPDCNDESDAIFPGAEELCNGIDDNCDGTVDEGCTCRPGDLEACFDGPGTPEVGICRYGWQQCAPDGKSWGTCQDQLTAGTEAATCDGIDSDCDGKPDPDELGCSGCPTGAVEVCGNGLDDDCNGVIDDPDRCVIDCSAVNPRTTTGALACCGQVPLTPYEPSCSEYPGLPSCASIDRRCLDLDGDPTTTCEKKCTGNTCLCGRPVGGGQPPRAVADCGFLSACSLMDCGGRTDQPCYSGAPDTLGKGVCKAGLHSCVDGADGSRAWDTCQGEVKPSDEVCGNGLDDDCDGLVDENDGKTGMPCAVRPTCAADAVEICGNGLDDDCDGFADEGCPAPAGGTQKCWTGSLATRSVGTCKDGVQHEQQGSWGPCSGQVLPGAEICGDGMDTDCNGLGQAGADEDPGCCVPQEETCNGLDDDCDGIADEGLRTACGTCQGSESCYGVGIDDPGDCTAPGRACTRIQPYDLDGQAITLGRGGAPAPSSVLWVVISSFSGPAAIEQIDIRSGAVLRSSNGPTSAFPLDISTGQDDSVWVLYYAFGTGTALQHFDREGKLVCALSGVTPAHITADPTGGAWLVMQTDFSGPYLLRRLADGSSDVNPDGSPACPAVDLVPGSPDTDLELLGSGVPVVDAGGWVWVAGTIVQRVDGRNPTAVEKIDGPAGALGADAALGIDDSLLLSSPFESVAFDGKVAPIGQALKDLAVIPDGTIWASQTDPKFGPDIFVHIDPATGDAFSSSVLPISGGFGYSTGLAVDAQGRIWSSQQSQIDRLDPATLAWDSYPVDGTPLIRPGSTTMPLRFAASGNGRFTQVVDSGSYRTRWASLAYQAVAVPGSRVEVRVRFADDPMSFAGSSFVCGPFEASPGSLELCSGGRRYAQLDVGLSGTSPVVGHFQLTWDRN